MIANTKPRRGVAMVWCLVVLAAVSVFSITIAGDFVAARKTLDRRRNRDQAELLARAGVTIAEMKLSELKEYKGETLKLMNDSVVKVTVSPIGDTKSFKIECVARYPLSNRNPVVFKLTQTTK
ncbi:hypothetical protein BH11PLA2_BH11PLA2_24690 [soil metagenome]